MKTKMKKAKEANIAKQPKSAEASCNDRDCPVHGKLKTRGRVFEGEVIRKFHRRVTIGFERMIYIRKYERYLKSGTKIHARLPDCMEERVNIGDTIKIQECRPLSKMIHFVVMKKIKDAEGGNEK
ncbi:MAG: 30S ribosomal protein S17 [Candidatus Pacearchaeota archaeon]